MTAVSEVYRAIDELAPFETAMRWDNCGLLVGSPEQTLSSGSSPVCVLALDVTRECIAFAKQRNAKLIVTHHPVIFEPIRSVSGDSVTAQLIREGIAVISAHTNLDLASGGVNDALADCLGLMGRIPLPCKDEIGQIGTLPRRMSPKELALYAKERLSAPCVSFTGSTAVERLAIVSGAGGEYAEESFRAGADALLTGEVKHHEQVWAVNSSFPLISAGHYATESVVLKPLGEKLEKKLPSVEFIVYDQFPLETV